MKNLKKILQESNDSIIAPGIYDALTAKLAEKKAFKLLWVSGFSVSASLFLPDNNSISIEKYIERISEIKKAINIPIIVDCDEGFGTIEQSIKLFTACQNINVECCCIEDNIFPKINSFLQENKQQKKILDKKSFSKKLRILKDLFPEIILIARTESLIAGESLQEAIDRARLYKKNGADLIVIHSKSKDLVDFDVISKAYGKPEELVVIPTLAYNLSPSDFKKLGFKIIIYANQVIRSNIATTNTILNLINDEENINKLNDIGISMDYIFNLTKEKTHV
ncbi:isocitrate lyase/PEP mutase family protein [Pedobacter gandavensis]|uniref:isocitrate lyase/PEP mutase family protein n=1 Tax=Pedobacter gandavensis TaxID=2679963 RepID=UPI00247A04A3|nr:isocitrate lyase/PEP mutase family protein [Pedobacter gandavensis]WGQ10941.1 isocitrate lyase/PEP mutase family protein [Pedobacter gandavensis]